MAEVQVTRAMDNVFDDGLGEIPESKRIELLLFELRWEAFCEAELPFLTRMRDLVSVVNRKGLPCRLNSFRSPCRILAIMLLSEAMSQENLDSDEDSFVLEKLIRSLFSIVVNKQDDTLLGFLWLDNRHLLPMYDVVVSAVAILALVSQHLLGQVNGGGCRTYSSGSLDFRDTYISVLLFLGAFVWIWFRDVAPRTWGRIYRRSKKDEYGIVTYVGKYEPRFKPPREIVTAGEPWIPSDLGLGGYDTHQDAEIVLEIACFYYGKDEGRLELGDGTDFLIPRMTERERGLIGKEKAKWVSAKAKAVFKDFKTAKAARSEVPEINVVASRQSSEDIIFAGRVKVNGKGCTVPQTPVNPLKDMIFLDGRSLPKKAPPKFYFALNKPKGYICSSVEDAPKPVLSLLEEYWKTWDKRNPGEARPRLFTVGRLDVATTGLLLITNDGDFAQRVSHPSSGLTKEYIATVAERVTRRQLQVIGAGTKVQDVHVVPTEVVLLPVETGDSRHRIRIVVNEGRNREVRELVGNAGLEVLGLKRVRIGGLAISRKLGPGKYEVLTETQVNSVLNLK